MRTAVASLCGALFLAPIAPGWAGKPQSATLCLAGEQTIFSCPLLRSTKLLSLCSSRDAGAGTAYLQYRFGRRGKVELEFPTERRDSRNAFRYSRYARYQVDRFSVSFSIGDYAYTVFDNYDGEMEPATREAGVAIRLPGKPSRELRCRGTGSGNLRELQSIVPCDKNDALNMGACS